MSIATKRGDRGKTDLIGRVRVSKAELRVECYGTIDELNAQMGFARSICEDKEVQNLTKQIQVDLFKVGSAIATPPEAKVGAPEITAGWLMAWTPRSSASRPWMELWAIGLFRESCRTPPPWMWRARSVAVPSAAL